MIIMFLSQIDEFMIADFPHCVVVGKFISSVRVAVFQGLNVYKYWNNSTLCSVSVQCRNFLLASSTHYNEKH